MGTLEVSIPSPEPSHGAVRVKPAQRRADLIHVHVMRPHFVPPPSIGPVVAAGLCRRAGSPPHARHRVGAPEVTIGDA